MINPIIIIVSVALLLSVVSVCIINKPQKPLITGVMILILIAFVVFTFLIDNAISGLSTGEANGLVSFLTMSDTLTYEGLSASFNTFMWLDIGLIGASLVSLFFEILIILRKGAKP